MSFNWQGFIVKTEFFSSISTYTVSFPNVLLFITVLSGLYIHIPFCKQACYYCDFHFSTNQIQKDAMVKAIIQELKLQTSYLDKPHLETIYFGGGTPSLLTFQQLTDIFDAIYSYYSVSSDAEITLEANPDDLDTKTLTNLRQLPINRLSIGIQSFYENHLLYMHRAHTASEGENCVKHAQDKGFQNLTIDLIYGIPHQDHSVWLNDLSKATALNISHISAYCLTIEPQTVFGKWVQQKKINPVDEEFSALQFEMMIQYLENAGFEQYEISNFAKEGMYARHNSSYWLQKHYLGIGPSAHSYNGTSRQFNVANNAAYIQAINQQTVPYTIETLSISEQINDYLLTTLRTRWGCNVELLQQKWQYDLYKHSGLLLEEYFQKGLLQREGPILKLTKSGKLLADEITAELFLIE
ncbi:radical SAM family heme chaperone HemW [Xanthocytophaga flavus]|uniref:radical SAM family heme chaperone HemW n=1 Tax=Xanthocytophaga flava TaxID=3048013 RepID=UPI0028D4E282|nr:radical SAM family heme chaperone HemW [Xanthocytophaga flavus]